MIISKNTEKVYFKNDSKALFITCTDQSNWGFNNNRNKLGMFATADIDENWRLCFTRYFKNLICYDIYKQANLTGLIAMNQELIEFAKAYKPEYIMHPAAIGGLVTLETLLELRNIGCKIVACFCDDDVYYDSLSRNIIPYVDYCVTVTDPGHVKKYIADGAVAFFSTPIGMASDIFCRFENCTKLYDVSFVGNQHVADRQQWIENLTKAGIDLSLSGGTGSGRRIHFSKFIEIINQSKINLHFSKNVINGELIDQLKHRVFEVTLCGGFLLCEYVPLIEEFFEVDKEIVCFKTVEEAVEKINYYLTHDEEREKIAQNGYIRANREYEGLKVIEKLFTKIEKSDRKSPPAIPEIVTPLHSHFSKLYTLWTKALLRSSYPLRAQWKECAELALRTDPGNKQIKRILLISKLLGDPQPVRGLCKLTYWHTRTFMNKKYVLMRKKLRFIKRILNKKS